MANSNPGTYTNFTTEQLVKLVFDTREEIATRQLAVATLYQRVMPTVGVDVQCDHIECAATNAVIDITPLADPEQYARAMGLQTINLADLTEEDIAQLPGAAGYPDELGDYGSTGDSFKDDSGKGFNPNNPFGNLN